MHIVTKPRVTALVAVLAMAGLAACDRHRDADPVTKADPSAVVIGTAPAEPSGDPPGTTPVSSSTTEISKSVEHNSMPLPGQPNDHSNLAPHPSQKAGADKPKGQTQ
jgi:hypothetical protein